MEILKIKISYAGISRIINWLLLEDSINQLSWLW